MRFNPLLQLNVPQQVFTLFYAIFWGTAANAQPRWKAFAWGAVGIDRATWRRAWWSVFLQNFLPLIYFVVILWLLSFHVWSDLATWDFASLLKVFVSISPAFAPFGFYRIWTASVQKWGRFFYGITTDARRPEVWKRIGITLAPGGELNPEWASRNFWWGLIYVIAGPLVVLLTMLFCAF
jgi:hypothetical protein